MKTRNLLILAATVITIMTSCEKYNNCINGSGNMVSRDYSISDFDELYVYGETDIILTKANETSLRIEGQENVLNVLDVEERNGDLSIGRDNCFRNSKRLKIYISTPVLNGIQTSGWSDVKMNGVFTGSNFRAAIEGAGDMKLNLDVQEFSAILSGEGSIYASGKADDQILRLSGRGKAHLFDLAGRRADVSVDGMGNVEINVSEALDVKLSGMGSVYYLHNPIISQHISGLGQVINAN